mgnify:CR=1 FL=1|jgi:hypothetical protein|tara:strand:+ start:485 stop:1015 length:531 start_codon:yes stop_codon:yes gene_type:complete
MKSTNKTLTLRGTTELFNVTTDFYLQNILDYANVLDISKAWKVRWFEAWPVELNTAATMGRDFVSIEAILTTEAMPLAERVNRADDNRMIAWSNTYYGCGGDPSSKAGGPYGSQVVVDPDHVIQKELNIMFRLLGNTTFEGEERKMNYIVYLEEVDISPTESILFTIKQSAQSLND